MPLRSRLCLTLLLLGVAAAASLLLVPSEMLLPELGGLPPAAVRLLTTLQPLLLVAAATAIGCALAPRVALGAPLLAALLARQPAGPVLARQLPWAVAVGVLVALVLLGYGVLSAPYVAEAAGRLGGSEPLPLPLLTRLLYGGIGEELMMRWGLMSALVWLGWRLSGRPELVPYWVAWVAIFGAALLFAVGHLPLLFVLESAPAPELVAMVLVGNALPGIGFGWLYYRFGLEAAMLAHGLAHLVAWGVGLVMGG